MNTAASYNKNTGKNEALLLLFIKKKDKKLIFFYVQYKNTYGDSKKPLYKSYQ